MICAPGRLSGRAACVVQLQIRRLYPALEIADIRGNLDTRLRKLDQGQVDALALAAAGLERMGWQAGDYFPIAPEISLPAPGQGALAVEIRDERRLDEAVVRRSPGRSISPSCRHRRAGFSVRLGGGCQVPVGALALVDGNVLRLQGIVIRVDGQRWLSGAG